MRTRNRKDLRKDRLKRYLKAKYGMKYDKGGKTGEGNPPEADFLLKRDPLADYDRETVGIERGAQDLDTGGYTTASDNARAQMDVLIPPEAQEEVGQRPEDMAPMPSRGLKVLRRDRRRGLMTGGSGIPTPTRATGTMEYVNPSTSNVRVHGPGGLYGEQYEKEKVPIGFRDGSGYHYGTPELFKKLREEGISARGQLTEDTMRELYETNPELFMDGRKGMEQARSFVQNQTMEEVKRGVASDRARRLAQSRGREYDAPSDEYYYINNQ